MSPESLRQIAREAAEEYYKHRDESGPLYLDVIIISAIKRATEKKDETLRTIQVQMPCFSYALQRPSGEFKGYDVWLHDYIAEALK